MKTQHFTRYPSLNKKKLFKRHETFKYDHQPNLMVELDITDNGLN